MNEAKIFVSVSNKPNQRQEEFIRAIEDRLKSENLIPRTIGRNTFSADSPIKTVMESMNESSGAIIIAIERTFFPSGIKNRGSVKEIGLENIKYSTSWNQIEAALAYSKGLPLMVIVEEGITQEGLLEKGYDWYVMNLDLETTTINSSEFNGVFSSWKKKVEAFESKSPTPTKNAGDQTITELVASLKTSQVWGVLVALATLIGGSFALGAKFFLK